MNRLKVGWLMICILILGVANTDAQDRELLIVNVADAISPAIAEFLQEALEQASQTQAACLIITLDTPGGLAESMRKIVQAIYACKVPVVVYVSPGGARAASAGVMITMAADIAAMAPGTHIGAAHPVSAGGKEIGETMSKKVTNDMAAFAKGVAQRQGRNAEWAEKAVRESVSATASEALEKKIIDLIAKDVDDLIRQIHSREIKGKGQILVAETRRTLIQEGFRTKILKIIANPNIAYILLMIGLAGIYFELAHPGTIFPGVVGGIALILAFFSLHALPVNTAGILLIILSIIFFILELKVTSFGMLSVAGVISLILGSVMLFKGAAPQFQVAWKVLVPTVVLISAFFVITAMLVLKAHTRQIHTGVEGLINETGIVRQVDGLHGKIFVHGELWHAEFNEPVAKGDKVAVVAVTDLKITAVPIKKKSAS